MLHNVSMYVPDGFLRHFCRDFIAAASAAVQYYESPIILATVPEYIVLDCQSPIKYLCCSHAPSVRYLDKVRRDPRYFNRYTDFAIDIIFDPNLIDPNTINQVAHSVISKDGQYAVTLTNCHVQSNALTLFIELGINEEGFLCELAVPWAADILLGTAPVDPKRLPHISPPSSIAVLECLMTHRLHQSYLMEKIEQITFNTDKPSQASKPEDALLIREIGELSQMNNESSTLRLVGLAVQSKLEKPEFKKDCQSLICAIAQQRAQLNTVLDVENWAAELNASYDSLSNNRVLDLFHRLDTLLLNTQFSARYDWDSKDIPARNMVGYERVPQGLGFWAERKFKFEFDPFFDIEAVRSSFERLSPDLVRKMQFNVVSDQHLRKKIIEINICVLIQGDWAPETEKFLRSSYLHDNDTKKAITFALGAAYRLRFSKHIASNILVEDRSKPAVLSAVIAKWKSHCHQREEAISDCLRQGWPCFYGA